MRLVIRPAAREDILRQYRYYLIDKDAEAAAERFLGAAQSAIGYVFRRPGVGSPRSFRNPALKGLRSWPVKGFAVIRIYYMASEDEIRIVRVLHGKRDVGRLLDDEEG